MAVTVVRTHYNTGEPASTDVFEEGTGIEVRDGHLAVTFWNSRGAMETIGIYAPGSWNTVSKDTHSVFTRETKGSSA